MKRILIIPLSFLKTVANHDESGFLKLSLHLEGGAGRLFTLFKILSTAQILIKAL
ncbi:MAG: hypothetical protein ABJA79_05825 [Parafilimonas sp.]